MGDRVYATLEIGGRLETVEEAEKCVSALVTEELVNDEKHAQTVLRESVERTRCMWFEVTEQNYGTFDHVEAATKLIPGLMCATKYGAGSEFPEGWLLVAHIDGEAQAFSIPTNGGDPCIDYRDVKGIAELGDRPLATMVREKMELIKLAESIPPLSASPTVTAWLKIFGEMAA